MVNVIVSKYLMYYPTLTADAGRNLLRFFLRQSVGVQAAE
jgi:hypothetical protein